MSDLKRRPLNPNNRRPNQNQGPKPQKNPNENKSQNARPQPSRNQNRPQGQNNRPQNQRPQSRPVPRPAPPPPAYMQRDVLLIAKNTNTAGIEEVRTKLDPLAKKIPAHVEILYPEPAKGLDATVLSTIDKLALPTLESLTFETITIHNDMYLWLMPSEESKQKILQWREALLAKLNAANAENSQAQEDFIPHITLGYIPRSLTPEDAMAFAKNLVSLPLQIEFEKFLLEEFSENQISTTVESLTFA